MERTSQIYHYVSYITHVHTTKYRSVRGILRVTSLGLLRWEESKDQAMHEMVLICSWRQIPLWRVWNRISCIPYIACTELHRYPRPPVIQVTFSATVTSHVKGYQALPSLLFIVVVWRESLGTRLALTRSDTTITIATSIHALNPKLSVTSQKVTRAHKLC